MGVDITTYRSRIGTFRFGPGLDVILLRVCVNYSGGMKVVGTVAFIGLLLIMAGVEQNPGPLDRPTCEGEDTLHRILRRIGLERFINVFKENEVGIDEVDDLTFDDFKSMGMSIGARIKIQKACKQYCQENATKGNVSINHDNRVADNNEHPTPTKAQDNSEQGNVIKDDYYRRTDSCENLSQSLASDFYMDSKVTPDNGSVQQLHAGADNSEHLLSEALENPNRRNVQQIHVYKGNGTVENSSSRQDAENPNNGKVEQKHDTKGTDSGDSVSLENSDEENEDNTHCNAGADSGKPISPIGASDSLVYSDKENINHNNDRADSGKPLSMIGASDALENPNRGNVKPIHVNKGNDTVEKSSSRKKAEALENPNRRNVQQIHVYKGNGTVENSSSRQDAENPNNGKVEQKHDTKGTDSGDSVSLENSDEENEDNTHCHAGADSGKPISPIGASDSSEIPDIGNVEQRQYNEGIDSGNPLSPVGTSDSLVYSDKENINHNNDRADSGKPLSMIGASDALENPNRGNVKPIHVNKGNDTVEKSSSRKKADIADCKRTKNKGETTSKHLGKMFSRLIPFDLFPDIALEPTDTADHNRHRPGETTSQRSQLHQSFQQLLETLGLLKWFPGKVSIELVTAIDAYDGSKQKVKDITQLPWAILKRIIMTDSSARDQVIGEYFSNEDVNPHAFEYHEEYNSTSVICPLDVFITVFHCCDAMLKYYLYQKLFRCKLAVPLFYVDPECNTFTLSLWPLRSITIEYKTDDKISTEISIVKQSTKFVVFARLGRPPFSKSMLLNDLISKHKHDTFFNKECPLGMSKRCISSPYVEVSWYLPGGNDDLFNEVLTFVNVRGDLLQDFDEKQVKYIQAIGHVFVITLDVQLLRDNSENVVSLLLSCPYVVVILTNDKSIKRDEKIDECLGKLQQNFTKNRKCYIVHKRNEMNASQLKNIINKKVWDWLQFTYSNTICALKETLVKLGIKVDENDIECQKGEQLANKIQLQIQEVNPQTKWQETITAIQSNDWNEWSNLNKRLQRSFNNVKDVNELKVKMDSLKLSQISHVSEIMKLFIRIIVKNKDCKSRVLYFIEWLKLYLDDRSRDILPELRKKYNDAWDKLKNIKKKSKCKQEISEHAHIVKKAEKELANASFGIEHLFREMGQVYQSSICQKKDETDLPPLEDIAASAATLITYGMPFELLDGDASNIPSDWIHAVLSNVNQSLGNSKILTLSVLGIQSSGKSTLLNTMFGLQFAVSAGRCTRGVYMQLIRVTSTDSQFQYIMVIDSEGLRASELREQKKDHDNELATFVIGLGDVTLLVIKGENIKEINDILDITVHAFLRLKVVNKGLELRQKCIFIHQNVSAINAAEKMKFSVQKLVDGLDEMTKEAAYSENIHDITTFDQVIEFDGNKHVWYIPDLWHGDPPMAAVNSGYCKKVLNLKVSIMCTEMNATCKSFKSMSDIEIHGTDLWKGILKEDFVFSFKNSLEIKSYLQMEIVCNKIAWRLESFVQNLLLDQSTGGFNTCKCETELESKTDTNSRTILLRLDQQKQDSIKELEKYFNTNDYNDILIKWKELKINEIRVLVDTLNLKVQKELKQKADIRKLQIITSLSIHKYEETMKKESIELANQLKGQCISVQDKNKKFEDIWRNFKEQISHLIPEYRTLSIIFIDILYKNFFNTDKNILKEQLTKYKDLTKQLKLSKLYDSIANIDLTIEDIGVKCCLKNMLFNGKKEFMRIYVNNTNIVLQKIDTLIQRSLSEVTELGENHIREMFDHLTELINNIPKNQQGYSFTLKVTFKAKLYVYVSCYALECFERHNALYRERHGIKAQLKKFKTEVRTIFDDCLEDRQAEYTASTLFRTQLKCFINDTIAERLNVKVIDTLMNRFDVKHHIIIAILTDLANKDNFSDFLSYIKMPFTFAENWIKNFSVSHLFNEKSGKYFDHAKVEISDIVNNVNTAIITASKDCDNEGTIDDWVASFANHMKPSIPKEILTKHLNQQTFKSMDITNFKRCLESEMGELKDDVVKEFMQHKIDSVQWKKENPFKAVISRAWGCTELCVFCGEPCSKASAIHYPLDHSCVQHRVQGVNGLRCSVTKKVALESCNFDIQTVHTHTCSVFNFLCNPQNKEACKDGRHPFKEYKKYLKSWTIEPTSDMEDTCKYWMWFMAKYKQNLAECYGYDVDDIPESWGNYTKEQALKSL